MLKKLYFFISIVFLSPNIIKPSASNSNNLDFARFSQITLTLAKDIVKKMGEEKAQNNTNLLPINEFKDAICKRYYHCKFLSENQIKELWETYTNACYNKQWEKYHQNESSKNNLQLIPISFRFDPTSNTLTTEQTPGIRPITFIPEQSNKCPDEINDEGITLRKVTPIGLIAQQ